MDNFSQLRKQFTNKKLSKYVTKPTTAEKRELVRSFLKFWSETGSQVKAVYMLKDAGFKTQRGTPYAHPALQIYFRQWIALDPLDSEPCFTDPKFCGLTLTHKEFERMRVENAFALFRKDRAKILEWAKTFSIPAEYNLALQRYVSDGIEDDLEPEKDESLEF